MMLVMQSKFWLEISDSNIRKYINLCHQKQKKQDEVMKNRCKAMFSSSADDDTEKTVAASENTEKTVTASWTTYSELLWTADDSFYAAA